MVVTCLPATDAKGVTQERTAMPSTCTVQAPQRAMPQPNLVPGRPATPNLDRWYDVLAKRKAFQDHVGSIPLT